MAGGGFVDKRKKEIGGFHKYLIPAFAVRCLFIFRGVRAQAQELPSISAQSAALLVADTGEFYLKKTLNNSGEWQAATKIMTSLLAGGGERPNRVYGDGSRFEWRARPLVCRQGIR